MSEQLRCFLDGKYLSPEEAVSGKPTNADGERVYWHNDHLVQGRGTAKFQILKYRSSNWRSQQ